MQSRNPWQSGQIYFRPLSAQIEREINPKEKMSPFVLFKVRDSIAKTNSCISGHKTPQWFEEVTLKASRGDSLIVEIYDHNSNGTDTLIGSCSFKIDDIADEPAHYQYSHDLYFDGKVVAKLVFAASTQTPVNVYFASDDPEETHKRHKQYAANFQKGYVFLKPIEAHLTRDTDLLLKMTPQVVFKVNDQEVKTKVCHAGGKNPKWDEELQLLVSREDQILVEVWNCHSIGKPERIASCKITAGQIIDSKHHYQVDHPLSYGEAFSGTITIAASLLSNVKVLTLSNDPEKRHQRHIQLAEGWVSGTVFFRPIRATLKRDTGGIIGMNPYVVLTIGEKKYKSKTGSGKEPIFEEEFAISVLKNDFLLVEVWDKHTIGEDKLIGTYKLPLVNVVECKEHYQYIHPLVYEGKDAGSIIIAASLMSPVLIQIDPARLAQQRKQAQHMMHIIKEMNHMHH